MMIRLVIQAAIFLKNLMKRKKELMNTMMT